MPGFEDVLGHRDVKDRLGRSARLERVGSGYLFLGPAGVGRRLTAVAWAAVLNCEQPGDLYPYACGQCRPCRLIGQQQHPDLIQIAAEPNKDLKIEQIREAVREAHFKPYEAKKKVFLFDNADHMTDGAANALLKTLEEPSSTLVLILIAESEGRLLPTIRSRCQMVRFGALALDLVAAELVKRGASEQKARLLAHQSSGSLGRAIEALEEGETQEQLRTDLFQKLGDRESNPILGYHLAERYKTNDELGPVFAFLKSFYRDAVLLASGADVRRIANEDQFELVRAEALRHSPDELAEKFAAIEAAERRIFDVHANKQLVLDQLFNLLTA